MLLALTAGLLGLPLGHALKEVGASPPPKPSIASIAALAYQKRFEDWFDAGFFKREALIRNENSLNLWLFNEISARARSRVVLGENDHLYELKYIYNYFGADERDDAFPQGSSLSAEDGVKKLAEAARVFRALKMRFVYVLHPGKAEIYPEFIPKRWRLSNGRRGRAGYERFIELLKRHHVPFVDGPAVFHRLRQSHPGLTLFAKGGTHWTMAGTCFALRRALAVMKEQPGPPLPDFDCRLGDARPAGGGDFDIAELATLRDASRFRDQVPDAELVARTSAGAGEGSGTAPRAYFSGTSFSLNMAALMRAAGFSLPNNLATRYYRRRGEEQFKRERVFDSGMVFFEQPQASRVSVNLVEFVEDMETYSERYRKALEKGAGLEPVIDD